MKQYIVWTKKNLLYRAITYQSNETTLLFDVRVHINRILSHYFISSKQQNTDVSQERWLNTKWLRQWNHSTLPSRDPYPRYFIVISALFFHIYPPSQPPAINYAFSALRPSMIIGPQDDNGNKSNKMAE